MCLIFLFQNDLLGLVSVFKDCSINFQYYFYKLKAFSRKKIIFEGFPKTVASFPGVFQARANHALDHLLQ